MIIIARNTKIMIVAESLGLSPNLLFNILYRGATETAIITPHSTGSINGYIITIHQAIKINKNTNLILTSIELFTVFSRDEFDIIAKD
jgi:hypothetical protein